MDAIMDAGLEAILGQPAQPAPSPRREMVKSIRAVLRNQSASDDAVDDALEALLELSKE